MHQLFDVRLGAPGLTKRESLSQAMAVTHLGMVITCELQKEGALLSGALLSQS